MTQPHQHRHRSAALPSLKTLYKRTSLTVVLCSVVLVGVVMGLIGVLKLLSLAHMNLQLVARSAAVTIEASVYFDDREVMQEQLQQLLPQADVVKAHLSLVSGERFDIWVLPDDVRLRPWMHALVEQMFDPVSVAVQMQGETLATLTLWPKGERILRFMLSGLLALVVCMLLTGGLIWRVTQRLQRQLSEPLLELADITARVRSSRDFSLRVSRSQIAEIDHLRVDFNALLDELHQWQGAMEAMNHDLHYHAHHDTLTGVSNRHYFEKALQRALDYAAAHATPLSILYIDGDGFKTINDTYGHAAGDQVLQALAVRIQSALRETDLVARMGGDEFCVLLNYVGDLDEVERVCLKMLHAVNQPLELSSGDEVILSISIGVARYPEQGSSVDELMHAADAAMYGVKREGKNGCGF